MNNCVIIYLIGDDSKVDTPLPIPNREVKHFNGENSVSEDSKLPIFFFAIFYSLFVSFFLLSFFALLFLYAIIILRYRELFLCLKMLIKS